LVFGRALQVCLDLVLGFALQEVLLANADALVAFAAGEDVEWLPNARGEKTARALALFFCFASDASRRRRGEAAKAPKSAHRL
jgi:hypothetical protein